MQCGSGMARSLASSALLWSLLVFTQPSSAAEVGDIPLSKCTGAEAMVQTEYSSLSRTVEARKRAAELWQRLGALSARHPEAAGSQSVSEYLTKEEADNWGSVSAQIAVSNFYLLAETRLQRDMQVMLGMLEAATKLRDGGDVPDSNATESKYYLYLGVMREAFKLPLHPDARNVIDCSLDLSLQRDFKEASDGLMARVSDSAEYLEFLGLRAKYKMADGAKFDSVKLSDADAVRLPRLQKTMQDIIGRVTWYERDISNLRYFAEMAQIQFDELKSELVQLGPSRDVEEFQKLHRARFQSLSEPMRAVWNLWDLIDGQIPPEQAKVMDAISEISKGGSPDVRR